MAASDSVLRGLVYVFGRGMDPRGKDGVRAHPMVFVAGVGFHFGIAAALLSLVAALLDLPLTAWLRYALLTFSIAGTGSGLLLLARRLREPVLQAISVADDYVSNLLVVAFLAAAIAYLLAPELEYLLAVAAVILAIYAPFGKIRHCVLFFFTRARFGMFIGTRGVLMGRSPR